MPAGMQNTAPSWVGRTGWVLSLCATLLAIIAGHMIEQARTTLFHRPDAPPIAGWLLLGMAGLALAIAVWPPPKLPPSEAAVFLTGFRAMKRKALFLGPLVSAALCAISAIPLFWRLNAIEKPESVEGNWLVNTGAWVLYVVALLLFAGAFVVWERTTRTPEARVWTTSPPDHRLSRRMEWTLMLGLFGLALALRLVNLDAAPPGLWFDEAYHGYVARQLLEPGGIHKTFIPDIMHFGALYFYLLGAVLKVTGNTVWALRVLPAISGALIAPLLYLLAARLYGWRVGVAASGLLAVSAWNITFSRFGIVSMFTVVLDVGVILCLAQAVRTGRLGYFAGSGLLMGLALQAYYIARLVPLVLIVLLAHLLITEGARAVRALRAGAVGFAVGTLLASLPVGLFAVQRPDDFQSRLSTVSIFSPQNSGGDPVGALSRNLRTHLLMFNWRGDANGRHNLPGSPMLDWLAAAFFFAGLGSCLLRAWRWQYAFPVVWFAVTISAGVLSMPSEAPQSHRTLENSVATALLAGIFLGEVWALLARGAAVHWLGRLLERRGPRRSDAPALAVKLASAISTAGVVFFTGWVGVMDFHKYFEQQAKSAAVWSIMDGEKAYAARTALRYAARNDYDVYVAPSIKSTHAFQFLTPHLITLDWPGMYALPLSASAPAGAVIVLDPPSGADVAALARVYPHATFEVAGAPDQPPLLYVAHVPAADVEELRGARATLYDATSRQPKSDRAIQDLNYDWSGAGVSAGTVRLSSTLKVQQYGSYTFDLRSDPVARGSAQVSVDGYDVTPGQPVKLAVGLHGVVVTNTVRRATGMFSVYWSLEGAPPVPVPGGNLFDPQKIEPHGLTGLYRAGVDQGTKPETARVDPVISFTFQTTTLPRPYSIEWRGRLRVPQEGFYAIATAQRSSSDLFLDDTEIITNAEQSVVHDKQLYLSAGWHAVRLVFRDQDNYSSMFLYWTPPGHARSIIPSAFLWPVLGQYPSDVAQLSLEAADGTKLPPERVTHVPSRDAEGELPGQAEAPLHEQLQAAARIQGQAWPTATPFPTTRSDTRQPGGPREVKSLEPLFLLGANGTLPGKPRAAAADTSGNIYVITEEDGKIHKYGPRGKELAAWDVRDAAGNTYPEAPPLAIQGNRLFVLESVSAIDHPDSDVISYALDGRLVGRVHVGRCHFARGLAASRDGNFWVADTGYNRVFKVSPSGRQLRSLGEQGSQPGRFAEPASVWEAPDGTLFVADIGNRRVQSFTPDLKPLAQWPIGRSIARDGNRLTGEQAGNVLVTQAEDRAVVMYDKNGTELRRWFYRKDGEVLVPSGITSLGGAKFLALFPQRDVGVVFTTVDK
jgi:sugar lactone lactonase YvrE